jgi:hypothetical protein
MYESLEDQNPKLSIFIIRLIWIYSIEMHYIGDRTILRSRLLQQRSTLKLLRQLGSRAPYKITATLSSQCIDLSFHRIISYVVLFLI